MNLLSLGRQGLRGVGIGLGASCLGLFLGIAAHAQTNTQADSVLKDRSPVLEAITGAVENSVVDSPVELSEGSTPVESTAAGLSDTEPSDLTRDRFLPPPDLAELTEITKTAVVSPQQRKSQRSLVISLKQRRVYVYENDDLLVSYPVAIGKGGWETPKGEWKVSQMIKNPTWQHPWTGEIVPPGPDNPLGDRWIGFWTDGVNAIGFHGTPNESLVGQAVSHGCVRMKNAHIDAMFKQIAMGATVRVE